jgi:RNA polymerase sigma-70 factor (ECF subfamily)
MEKLVQQGIATLEEEHRALIVLRDVEDLSYQEICGITGLAEGTVKSRLHRARMALKEYLAKRAG